MKKLILGAVAVATLSTASFASSYEDTKQKLGDSFESIVEHAELNVYENGETVGYKIGKFYEKSGASVSYNKMLDVNINEVPNATFLNFEIGANGKDRDSIFANAEIKTYLLPFFWENEDSYSSVLKKGAGLVAGLKGTTFSHQVKKDKTITETKEILHEDPFGWDTWTETIESKKNVSTVENERTSDFVVSAGFYFKDEFGLTNSDIELTIGKGLLGNIDSEVSLKTNTMITKEIALSFEAKRTNVDSEDYSTYTIGLNYKF